MISLLFLANSNNSNVYFLVFSKLKHFNNCIMSIQEKSGYFFYVSAIAFLINWISLSIPSYFSFKVSKLKIELYIKQKTYQFFSYFHQEYSQTKILIQNDLCHQDKSLQRHGVKIHKKSLNEKWLESIFQFFSQIHPYIIFTKLNIIFLIKINTKVFSYSQTIRYETAINF